MLTKIDSYPAPAFRSLFVSDSIKSNKDKEFAQKYKTIEHTITDNKLDKKKNVDIILDYNNKTDKFYGVISSKKQGVPENPSNICEITPDKKDINIFKKWTNFWNKAYSPKEIEKWHTIWSMIAQK